MNEYLNKAFLVYPPRMHLQMWVQPALHDHDQELTGSSLTDCLSVCWPHTDRWEPGENRVKMIKVNATRRKPEKGLFTEFLLNRALIFWSILSNTCWAPHCLPHYIFLRMLDVGRRSLWSIYLLTHIIGLQEETPQEFAPLQFVLSCLTLIDWIEITREEAMQYVSVLLESVRVFVFHSRFRFSFAVWVSWRGHSHFPTRT